MQACQGASAHILRAAQEPARVLKFVVDGAQEALALHQLDASGSLVIDPMAMLAERHMQLANYAAHRQLSIDMFDAASSLQLGTASLSLQGLLRQGREHTEAVVQAPVFDAFEAFTVQQASAPVRTGVLQKGGSALAVSRGTLQARC